MDTAIENPVPAVSAVKLICPFPKVFATAVTPREPPLIASASIWAVWVTVWAGPVIPPLIPTTVWVNAVLLIVTVYMSPIAGGSGFTLPRSLFINTRSTWATLVKPPVINASSGWVVGLPIWPSSNPSQVTCSINAAIPTSSTTTFGTTVIVPCVFVSSQPVFPVVDTVYV